MEYAHKLLVYFVANSKDLCSVSFCSCNVHSLIHLHDDVTNFGCSLDEISCFPFKNHLKLLKKFVCQVNNPTSQVVKHIHDLEINSNMKKNYNKIIKMNMKFSKNIKKKVSANE